MSKATNEQTQQLAFRLTHAEVAWLQAEAERLSAEFMVPMTMTSVVRRLIAVGMKGSPTVPTVVAPVADVRQLAIPGAVAPVTKPALAKVVEAPVTKPAKVAPASDDDTHAARTKVVHAALRRANACREQPHRRCARLRRRRAHDTCTAFVARVERE